MPLSEPLLLLRLLPLLLVLSLLLLSPASPATCPAGGTASASGAFSSSGALSLFSSVSVTSGAWSAPHSMLRDACSDGLFVEEPGYGVAFVNPFAAGGAHVFQLFSDSTKDSQQAAAAAWKKMSKWRG